MIRIVSIIIMTIISIIGISNIVVAVSRLLRLASWTSARCPRQTFRTASALARLGAGVAGLRVFPLARRRGHAAGLGARQVAGRGEGCRHRSFFSRGGAFRRMRPQPEGSERAQGEGRGLPIRFLVNSINYEITYKQWKVHKTEARPGKTHK